jgi:hypothetical protein
MTGFQTTRAKRKKLQLVLLPTIAVLVSTFLLMPRDESVATPAPQLSTIAPKVDSCNVAVNRGVEISGTLSRYESIEISGQKYKIAEINKLNKENQYRQHYKSPQLTHIRHTNITTPIRATSTPTHTQYEFKTTRSDTNADRSN